MTLIEFECRQQRFALPIGDVVRVVSSARPALLPGAPDIVLGVLNVGSDIVTVVDFSRRMGFSPSPIDISQRLLIADVSGFRIGFIVDTVVGVVSREFDSTSSVPQRLAGAKCVRGLVQLHDGLSVLVDLEQFLFADEKAALGDALEKACHAGH